MMKLMQRLMFMVIPNCREAEQLQSRKLDEKLSLVRRAGLWMHCVICSCCRRFGIQLKFLSDLCKEVPEHCDDLAEAHPMPEDAKERVRERIVEETKTGSPE